MNTTARIALKLIPDSLQTQPVFLCVDDTMVSKFGTKFENVSKLFDHAAHNGSNYLNGHCFVSVILCVPVWNRNKVSYLSVPLGYRMWQKKESKLEPARTGRRGRPAKHGKRLSVETDFTFSDEKIGDYYTVSAGFSLRFSETGKSLPMSLPLRKIMVQNDCFSVQFSRKICKFSAHGRKKRH